LNFGDASDILHKNGYFDEDRAVQQRTDEYYSNICSCNECRAIIGDNINNFNRYSESTPFTIKKTGVKRNLPTTDASLIAAKHYLWCKKREWECVEKKSLAAIKEDLLKNSEAFDPASQHSLKAWCELYAR
jgi:hypothetical protein